MARILTAPDYLKLNPPTEGQPASYSDPNNARSLFLAGGITNCQDWQSYVCSKLEKIPNLLIMNPRRPLFDVNIRRMTDEQIAWEHFHLGKADILLYWFAAGSVNPITLFEYGRWGRLGTHGTMSPLKRMFVGCDPNYERSYDIIKQTDLDHGPPVHDNIDTLIDLIRTHLEINSK